MNSSWPWPTDFKGEILRSVPMAEYTSFRVGGPVDLLAFPTDREDLKGLLAWARERGLPHFVLGNGTNLLVRDGGIRGLGISLLRGFGQIREIDRNSRGSRIHVEAGVSLRTLIQYTMDERLTGLEWAAGIPGSVGGALFMNAGAFQGEMKDHLLSLEILSGEGENREIPREALSFSYRALRLPPKAVILSATFHLSLGEASSIRGQIENFLQRRKMKQPLDLPSAGSVFKNPPQGPAGRLIEEAGLKGLSVGDAQVSEKHANFIVNRGKAQARDILALIAKVREAVFQKTGVRLELEIHVLGED
jgi:UDP-N-acetylmuramate dehydrogenase